MIYGFYFRFYKMTKNKILSVILSYIARVVFLFRFQVKRLIRRRDTVNMSSDEALNILNEVYPDPQGRPLYNRKKLNDTINLSIIVPVYNYAELIEKNIESILNQKTKYSFELILVDDGSTDGAREIVLKYSDHPNVFVILQENKGIAGARNTGIDNASGKYIMFVDCDDFVYENIVEILMDRAIKEDCDIVMCGHNLVKQKNGQTISVIPNIYPGYNLLGYKNNDIIMNYAGLPWAKVYKRELFEKVRFFPGYWYEDTIIQFLLFSQCNKFSYVPKVEYEYRWYEKNFSHTQEKAKNIKAIDRYWMLLAIIEQYKKIGMPLDAKFYTLLLRHLSAYYYKTISELDHEVVEAMFVLAKNLLEQYKPQYKYKLPYMLRVTEKAILSKDINLWKLASNYQ